MKYTVQILFIFFSALFIGENSEAQLEKKGSGSALYFDGGSDYVDCGTDASLDLQTSMTLSAWIKPDATGSSWQGVINKGKVAGRYDQKDWWLGLDDNGKARFNIADGSGSFVGMSSPNQIPAGQWTLVMGVWNGSEAWLYVDGVLVRYDGSASGTASTNHKLRLGGDASLSGRDFAGDVDEVRVWSRPLSQTEVREYMIQKLGGNESGLVGYWRFDEGSGTTANDDSGNGNDGTLN